jgi:hypothetical protein
MAPAEYLVLSQEGLAAGGTDANYCLETVEDVAWATAVYRRAVAAGLGTTVRLWDAPVRT